MLVSGLDAALCGSRAGVHSHGSMPLFSRRTFAAQLGALVATLAVARRALAERSPLHRDGEASAASLDHASLLALGGAVLPSELGDVGSRRAVAEFERWLDAYRGGAEVLHGYGTAKLERIPPSPQARWTTQLTALDRDARKQHGRPFAQCAVAQRRALVHDRLQREKLGPMPSPAEASHVAIGLLAHFYASAEAADLCYRAEIGRGTCRPLAEQARQPSPLRRPV